MKKRILALLLAAVMVMALVPAVFAAEAHVNPKMLEYKVENDGTVTITKCPTGAAGTLEIPATIEEKPVTKIGYYAFLDCKKITKITLPASVVEIAGEAFANCESLTSVSLPAGLKTIANGVFEGCTGLTSVALPNGLTTLGELAFSGCTSLTSVTLPAPLTDVSRSLFAGCTGLTSVKLPNTITSIRDTAFSGCSALASISIPNSVTEMGSRVFEDCVSLKTVTTPASLTEMGNYTFWGCTGLTSATINGTENVIDSASGLFSDCTSLETVTIKAPITGIRASNMFRNCSSLKTVYLPGTLYEITDATFSASDEILQPNDTPALTDVYFDGSEYDWTGAAIGDRNGALDKATVHFRQFGDVSVFDWYGAEVEYAVEHGLMQGIPGGKFDPDGIFTQGQILTLLARRAGVDTRGCDPWYQAGVDWAKEEGVSDGEKPEETITRAELATLLYRCADSPAVSTSQMNKWPDASSIPDSEAVSAMAWCVENGLINGTGDGELLPLGTTTRAQVAVMMQRYCTILGD